ncbi:MAG: sirohydrochlorin chelatase [Microcoleaceae cyanobacterium]
MNLKSTYFLLSHGSRDPQPQIALEQLAQQLRQRYPQRFPLVSDDLTRPQAQQSSLGQFGTGVLEFGELSLHQQLQNFGQYTRGLGLNCVKILPLFLFAGMHVREDIPIEVSLAQQVLGSKVDLQVLPFLGSQTPQIVEVLKQQIHRTDLEIWILMGHGSRRTGGNQPMEHLAKQLASVPAYWSTSPSLEDQVQALAQQGYRRIGILPYFIFAGGITEAIAQSVNQLCQRFPQTELHLKTSLDQSGALFRLVEIMLG